MRIVQISDTHLSRDKPDFLDNWVPLAAWIADQHPDLVIHTGDVTVDGAGVEADLSFSARLMDELDIRWRAVPGNHDVGDPRHARQPLNAERLRAWQRHFGPDRWVEDVAEGAQRWRLVGLDALLLGSGEPQEEEQALWLEQVMAEAGERRIAWFLHRPLFLEDPGEGDSFLVGAPQPQMPGEKRLGAVVYEFDEATLTARIAAVPGLTQHWLDR